MKTKEFQGPVKDKIKSMPNYRTSLLACIVYIPTSMNILSYQGIQVHKIIVNTTSNYFDSNNVRNLSTIPNLTII